MQANDEINDRLTVLFEKQFAGQLTPEERIELMGLFLEPSLQPQLQQLVRNAWNTTGEEYGLPEEKKESLVARILESSKAPTVELAPHIPRLKSWKRWTAAAAVILLFGAGALLFRMNNRRDTGKTMAVVQDVPAPKTNKAKITLSNGTKVDLDSMANGQIALQGTTRLVKLDNGQIVYEAVNSRLAAAMQYNTLENPRGSKVINMTLADGSHVWLNAGSSITYPVAFSGNERKVAVNGEAFFDIKHDAKRPFYVTKKNTQVEVLGTQFNINAYDDEPDTRVTLLEGSVKVILQHAPIASGKPSAIEGLLTPGQQAQVTTDINVIKDTDIDEVMAWKNGLFSFHGVTLEAMMRQIARWYDMKVTFKGAIPDRRFGGKIYRDANISKVLEILEESNVHYRINGKEIDIMP